jgi:hypothetical protein
LKSILADTPVAVDDVGRTSYAERQKPRSIYAFIEVVNPALMVKHIDLTPAVSQVYDSIDDDIQASGGSRRYYTYEVNKAKRQAFINMLYQLYQLPPSWDVFPINRRSLIWQKTNGLYRQLNLRKELTRIFSQNHLEAMDIGAFQAQVDRALTQRRLTLQGRGKLLAALGAQSYQDRIAANISQARPMAVELSGALLDNDEKDFTGQDRESLQYLAAVARGSSDLKTPLGLIVPREINGSVLDAFLESRGALAALKGRFYILKKDDARPAPDGPYSMEKLLSLAEARLGAKKTWAGKMDVFLANPDEWSIEKSVRELVRVILRLVDDLTYDALDSMEKSLRALREAEEAA